MLNSPRHKKFTVLKYIQEILKKRKGSACGRIRKESPIQSSTEGTQILFKASRSKGHLRERGAFVFAYVLVFAFEAAVE